MARHLLKSFRRMPRRSLGRQVMSVLGTAMLIILVVFTAGATFFVYRAEGIAWRGRQSEAARNAAGTVAAVVQRARDTLAVVSIIKADILESHQGELVRLLDQNPTLEEVIRLDAEGHVFVDAHRDRSILAQLITIQQSQWFLNARSGRPYLGPVQVSSDDQPYLLMAVPAPDGGVVAARVQLSALWDAVADIRFGETGRAYVVTREGIIVAHTQPDVVFAGTNIADRPELTALLAAPNTEWHGEYTNFEGDSVVGATAPVPGADWVVITELPQAEAFAASRAALLMLGGGLLILITVTMWFVARFIQYLVVRPMTRLREGADRIGRGDLEHRINLARRDEIGQLAQAFDEMADRLRERNEQVNESEKLYRLLAENATDVIWMRDMTLRMTYISPSVAKLRGFSVEEALPQPVTEILTPASAEQAQRFFLEILMLAGQAGPGELRSQARSLDLEMVRKDGSTVWTESQMSFLLDDQGQPSGILGVTRDITERRRAAEELRRLNLELEDRVRERTAELVRVNAELTAEVAERQRAEAALRESETRLRRITDNMLDLIVQVDVAGVYQYASPSHKSVMGLEAGDLVGKPMFDFVHPDDLAQVAQAAQLAIATHETIQMEVRCRHANGRYLWLESVGNPLLDEAGQVIGAIIGSRDVTERKQAEALLRQAEAKYRTLVENIPAAVFIWELSEVGACRYVSPQIEAMLGFPVEDWLADPELWRRQLHPDDRARAVADHNHTLATGQPLHAEYRLLGRDGRVVWVRDEGVVMADEAGQPRLNQGYLLDITEQKKAEAQIQASLREKEALLKEIHHRVKNNLQIISSLLSLQANTVADGRMLEILRESQNRVKSMALVHEKLYRSPDLARIDFAEYVRSLTAQLFRTYSTALGGVALKQTIESIWLDVDTAISCGLIINELVSNALKHAFPDGREGEIEVAVCRHGDGHIILQVSDTGVGFPATIDFRNTPSLGLQLVNTLTNQIGGVVELNRNRGAEFKIIFEGSAAEAGS